MILLHLNEFIFTDFYDQAIEEEKAAENRLHSEMESDSNTESKK
jgi:hypothetical protein